MKVTIQRTELSLATARSQGAISDRAMAQMGLKTHEGKLETFVADRVLAVYSKLTCDVIEEGTCFVPARFFSDVVRELPDGLVHLTITDRYLLVTAGENDSFEMKIPLVQDSRWQNPPEFEKADSADLQAESLNYMINQVQFCVAHESPRNYGCVGFLHRPEDGKLRLVGTDGFRLSYSQIAVDIPDNFLREGVSITKRGLSEIQRMCSEGYETIKLVVFDDQTTLLASAEDYKIYVRLSTVKYPKYEGVLPTANMTQVMVSKPHIQGVTKRVLLAADKSRALQLCFSDSSLTLRSRTVGSSEGKESIPLNYRDDAKDMVVNGKFLSDVFSTLESNEVSLNFRTKEDPFVLMPANEPQNCHSMHVLVPIRESE